MIACICSRVPVCLHVFMGACMCLHVDVYVQLCMCACMCACMCSHVSMCLPISGTVKESYASCSVQQVISELIQPPHAWLISQLTLNSCQPSALETCCHNSIQQLLSVCVWWTKTQEWTHLDEVLGKSRVHSEVILLHSLLAQQTRLFTLLL